MQSPRFRTCLGPTLHNLNITKCTLMMPELFMASTSSTLREVFCIGTAAAVRQASLPHASGSSASAAALWVLWKLGLRSRSMGGESATYIALAFALMISCNQSKHCL